MTSFRRENHYHFKKTAARHSYPIGTDVNSPCHFFCFLFLCSEKALPFGDFNEVFVAVSIFFANRNGDAFEKTIINHFEMSRPADRGSVIRSDNCHAGLVIYHSEEIVIEHIEKRIIFSCRNEGEYSGYNPAHTCHVTGVRDLRSDSAVPYTVTVYSAYFIRTTARVSCAVGNPGNLGCVLCRTETAVELAVPHTVDCLADLLLWLSGLTASAICRLRSQATVCL